MAAVLKLVKNLVKKRLSCRVVVFVDSNVIRCAVNKGRSSSHALSSMLKQLGALAVGGGIYLFLVYSPTRLNPADDPTRGRELRSPQVGLDLQFWKPMELQRLSSVSHLKRFASNWVRLVLRLLGPDSLWYADRSLYRSSPNALSVLVVSISLTVAISMPRWVFLAKDLAGYGFCIFVGSWTFFARGSLYLCGFCSLYPVFLGGVWFVLSLLEFCSWCVILGLWFVWVVVWGVAVVGRCGRCCFCFARALAVVCHFIPGTLLYGSL